MTITTTYTPNLGLRITADMAPDDKYNLNKIDTLAAKFNKSSSGDTLIASTTTLTLAAASGVGIQHTNGTITLDAGNLQSLDTTSRVDVKARTIRLLGEDGTQDAVSSVFYVKASTADFTGVSVLNLTGVSVTGLVPDTSIHEATYNHADIALNTAARHSHTNKAILDLTTAAFTAELKTQYDSIVASSSYTTHLATLSASDISNGYITLPATPTSPTSTICSPAGAPSQFYGVDFSVSGNLLLFTAGSMLNMKYGLEAGDKITVIYR